MDISFRKNTLTILIVFVATNFGVYDPCQAALQGKAYEAYVAGNYDEALQVLNTIEQPSPHVLIYKAYIYQKNNDIPKAWIACKQAELSYDATIMSWCAQLKKDMGVTSLRDRYGARIFKNSVLPRIPLIALQLIALLAILLLLMCMVHRNKHFMLCIVLMGINGFLLLGLGSLYYDHSARYGLTVTKDSLLYRGPGIAYGLYREVPMLHEVLVIEKKEEWVKIAIDGTVGWIPAESLVMTA